MINKAKMGGRKRVSSERGKGSPQAGNGVQENDGRNNSASDSPNPQSPDAFSNGHNVRNS